MKKQISQEINICLSTDDNYIQHTATVVASILSNAKKSDNYHFYILSSQLSDENKKKFDKLKKIKDCKVDYITVNYDLIAKFKNVDTHKHLNLSVYNRLFIPDLFPNHEKMIYLDSDIVVIQDISDLNNLELEDAYFAGVLDPFAKQHSKTLGYENAPYINSGVMVINCKALRNNNYLSNIFNAIDFIKDKAKAGDQDFINYCFHNHIKLISSQWNVFLPFNFKRYNMQEPKDEDYILSKRKPKIIHFVGAQKPWLNDTNHPYKSTFVKYFKKTMWSSENKSLFHNPFHLQTMHNGNYKKYKVYFHNKKILSISRKVKINKENTNMIDFKNCKKEIIEHLSKQLRYDISFYNSVSLLHTKTFSKYKNINSGKKVVLLATGPSLDQFIPIKDAIYIGVNKSYSYTKVQLDYLFVQDYEGAKFYIDEIEEYKKQHPHLKLFYGLTGYVPNDPWLIPESVALRHQAERYYNLYRPEEKIWGEDFTYDILCNPLKCFGSITFAVMQFILWTNPKCIYLVGCDNSLNGYAHGIINGNNKLNTSQGMNGWTKLKKFADKFYPETEIISINPVGLKGIFKDIYQK